MPADDLVDVTVWLLVDADGRAVADCNPDVLRDEYHCDVGDLDPGRASQLYRVTVRVPRPVPIACMVTAAAVRVPI